MIIPLFITTPAAIICTINFTNAGNPFTSSIKQVMIMISAPNKKPANFTLYCSTP